MEVVDDKAGDNADWEHLRDAVLLTVEHATVLFIVDGDALGPDYPIPMVDLNDLGQEPFRCFASRLWSVDNDLNIVNMGWEEFSEDIDAGALFKGSD